MRHSCDWLIAAVVLLYQSDYKNDLVTNRRFYETKLDLSQTLSQRKNVLDTLKKTAASFFTHFARRCHFQSEENILELLKKVIPRSFVTAFSESSEVVICQKCRGTRSRKGRSASRSLRNPVSMACVRSTTATMKTYHSYRFPLESSSTLLNQDACTPRNYKCIESEAIETLKAHHPYAQSTPSVRSKREKRCYSHLHPTIKKKCSKVVRNSLEKIAEILITGHLNELEIKLAWREAQ